MAHSQGRCIIIPQQLAAHSWFQHKGLRFCHQVQGLKVMLMHTPQAQQSLGRPCKGHHSCASMPASLYLTCFTSLAATVQPELRGAIANVSKSRAKPGSRFVPVASQEGEEVWWPLQAIHAHHPQQPDWTMEQCLSQQACDQVHLAIHCLHASHLYSTPSLLPCTCCNHDYH